MKSLNFFVLGISSMTVLGQNPDCGKQVTGESRYSPDLDACLPCIEGSAATGIDDCIMCGNFYNGTTRLDVSGNHYSCSDCPPIDYMGAPPIEGFPPDQWPTYAEHGFLDCKIQPTCHGHDDGNGDPRQLDPNSIYNNQRAQCTTCSTNYYSTNTGTDQDMICHPHKSCGLQNNGAPRLSANSNINPGYCEPCGTGFYAPAGHYDCQSIDTLVYKGFLPFDVLHGDTAPNYFGGGNAIKDCDAMFGADRGYIFAPKVWDENSLPYKMAKFIDQSELYDVARHIWQCKRSNLDILIRELKVSRQSNKAAQEKYSESLYLRPIKIPGIAPINKNVLQYLQQLDPDFVENNYIGDQISR